MDCGLSEGTSSPPLLESCLQEHKTPLNGVRIRPIEEKERLKPTFTSLFLRGLPTAVAQTRDRLDVTLADRRRVKHKLGGASQADRKSCRAHQNPRDSYQHPAEEGGLTYSPAKCVSSQSKWSLPASAGCTGLEPFRFFTGTVGTLKRRQIWVKNCVTKAARCPSNPDLPRPALLRHM